MKEENLDYRGLFRFKHFGEIALNFNLDAIPSNRFVRKLERDLCYYKSINSILKLEAFTFRIDPPRGFSIV